MSIIQFDVDTIAEVIAKMADLLSGREYFTNSVWVQVPVAIYVDANDDDLLYMHTFTTDGDEVRVQSQVQQYSMHGYAGLELIGMARVARRALQLQSDVSETIHPDISWAGAFVGAIVNLFNQMADPSDWLPGLFVSQTAVCRESFPVNDWTDCMQTYVIYGTYNVDGPRFLLWFYPLAVTWRERTSDGNIIRLRGGDTWNAVMPLNVNEDEAVTSRLKILTDALLYSLGAKETTLWRGRSKRVTLSRPQWVVPPVSDGTMATEVDRLCSALMKMGLTQEVAYDENGSVEAQNGIVRSKDKGQA